MTGRCDWLGPHTPLPKFSQAVGSLDDTALVQCAPALSVRLAAAQSAVAAIPERPATSSFFLRSSLRQARMTFAHSLPDIWAY